VGSRLSFDNDLFLQILLPPIIFQAALSIDKRAFRRDLFPILLFAGLGTAFSAIAIGWITHKVSQWGNHGHLPLLDSLVFGSLIASIDPVATLSILASAGVSQTDTLYTLIFGESLLNDGVAIVLFDTLKSHLGGESGAELDESAYHQMANHFAAVLFGSIGIGLAVGFCSTLYFCVLRGQQTAVTEVAVFFCWALVPYYIAEAVGWSGIIAIMVMGFFMDYFVVGGFESEQRIWMDYMAVRSHSEHNEHHVDVHPRSDHWAEIQATLGKAFGGGGHILSESRHHVGFVAHVIANLMETAIFAYLGLFLFSDNVWNLSLNLTAILSCVTSRALMVVALSFLINAAVFFDLENQISKCFRSPNQQLEDDDTVGSHTRVYLDRKTQLILLFSGVRGAVSFTLVESIPVWDAVTKVGSQYKAELKAMTSTSIVFTLFVFGALTYIVVKQGDASNNSYIAGSRLTHRLLSEPLDSDDENRSTNPDGFSHSVSLEIEHPPGGVVRPGQSNLAQHSEPYRAPTNHWHE
jgi:NhaP-type Na+/H+ or K+/H+ antiporter